MLANITPLIITHNEAPNIRRTLAKLAWAKRIVVIDSGSTDGTIEILMEYKAVNIIAHEFKNFSDQCNFGLTFIESEWVLSLDADYELSDELLIELKSLAPPQNVNGFRARFVYRIYGNALRGSLYPPRTVLYRSKAGSYRSEGHGHRLSLAGAISELQGVIYHDDRKPLARWLTSQQTYARIEARHLLETPGERLTTIDKVRRRGWVAPIAVFLFTLFAKRCILDGRAGLYYALQRLLAETLVALEIMDHRLRNRE